MLDRTTGKFEFPFSAEDLSPVPDLSNIERSMLREYAKEGGPIWKIVKSCADQARVMERSVALSDLTSEAGRLRAVELQGRMNAFGWLVNWFEGLLGQIPEDSE